MPYQVLSRKYRPHHFDDLVGQAHVARILQNALASERVGHAYLFVGPRGVGKTTTARIFAKALNCAARAAAEDPQAVLEPCGVCPSCRDITAGSDLDVVEMDAASNNHVEDVRALREQVGYATVRSPHRIWIVDEVHMLSLPAFNAFLKTLEEPPAGVKFIFCTTEEHKLPDTFRSRCQRVEFRPIDAPLMAARLRDLAEKEGVRLADDVADAIATGALGGLRDAESLLDQLLAACAGGEIQVEDLDTLAGRAPGARLAQLTEAVDRGDAAAALDAVDACLQSGCKPGVLFEQWLDVLRAQMLAAVRETAAPSDGGSADGSSVARIARAIDVLLAKRVHLRAGADGTLVAQVAAVELARLPDARDLDALIESLRADGGSPERTSERGRAAAPPRPATRTAARDDDPPARRAPPTPAPDVEPPEPAGSAPASPAPEARWGSFLEAASRRDARLGALLQRLEPGPVEGGAWKLTMPQEVEGARATLARREIQIAFSQVAREVVGQPLQPVLQEAPQAVPSAAGDPTDLRDHSLVDLVTKTTGGRLLQVERRDAEPGPSDADG